MENPFKKIQHKETLPEVIKEKVLKDVSRIQLALDLADLFVVKYPDTIGDLLMGGGAMPNSDKEKEDKNKNNEE